MPRRAPFIVIEGLDRSGKTTQTSLLHAHLESLGIPVKLLKFPDRTTAIGKMIDSYLRSQSELDDHAIHLLFSANRWELASTITTLLNSGTAILCDRYAFSGIAFSASKPSLQHTFPTTQNDALPWCRSPDISLPAPDLTIFLDITPEQAKLRGGYGEERYEKEGMQKRVREVFYRLGEEMSTGDDVKKWFVLDAGRERQVVAEELWKLVEPLTRGIDEKIRRLWEDKLSC
ncbi:Thymidylate kinase [Leucoagaricus sp. SymC.cos]|nr:Thymidylate kinase [Leucoagaricus sp. SymC.cos]